jgi:hypothetical protein
LIGRFFIFLGLVILSVGCVQLQQEKPVFVNTPIPPEGILYEFSLYYNQRNSTAIYSMFSDKVKANYTLADVEEQLRFAENHDIEIIKRKALNETVRDDLHVLKANLTLIMNGETKEISIDFPVRYVRYKYETDRYTILQFNESVDEWIFDKLHFLGKVREIE